MRNRLDLLVLWLLLSVSSWAQSPLPRPIKFRHFTVKDGLGSQRIADIAQDRRGFLWIATENGLNRFDGHLFRQYHLPARQAGQPPDNSRQCFAVDGRGKLWVLSQLGLAYYDETRDLFRFVATSLDTYTIRSSHHVLYDSTRNCLWLSTSRGLFRYDLRTGHTHATAIRDMFRPFRALCITGGRLLIAASEGAFVYDPTTNKSHFYSVDDDPQEHFLCAFADIDGRIWMGRNGKALVEFNPSTGVAKHYFPETYVSKHSFVGVHDISTVPAMTGDSILWMATYDQGLLFFNRNTRTFVGQTTKQASLPEGLVSNQIDRLVVAHDGGLWLANQALSQVDPHDQAFHIEMLNLSALNVQCVLPNRELPNHLWIATLGNGLLDYDQTKGSWTHSIPDRNQNFNASWVNRTTLPQGYINDLCYDNLGRLWVAWGGGLTCYTPTSGTLKNYVFRGAGPHSSTIRFDQDNYAWASSDEQLCRLEPQTGQMRFTKLPAWPGQTDFPVPIQLLPDGPFIWVGSSMGLFQVNRQTGRVLNRYRDNTSGESLHNNTVYSLCKDRQGTLWLACYEGGMKRVWPRTGRVERIAELDAAGIHPMWVGEDRRGYIWIQTANGFYRYQPVTRLIESFTSDVPFFQHGQYSTPVMNNRGEWCAVQSGNYYTVFNPDHLPDRYQLPLPLPIITAFHIFDKSQPFAPDSTHLRDVSLRYDQNVIRFDFTSPEFSRMARLRFAYQLVGFDEQWVDAGTNRTATYTNLNGGNYVFRVRVGNAAGQWSPKSAEFRIYVQTPYWRTWWFYALCAGVFVGLIYALFRYREEERIRLRFVRDRIARDLHDDMGSYLSSISIMSQTARRLIDRDPVKSQTTLDTIGETSRLVMASMSDIVWSVNPAHDSLPELVERLRNVAADLFVNADTVCEIVAHKELTRLELAPDVRRDLYFICKEALTNAARHAQASRVFIRFQFAGNTLHLTISDDGQGFDLADAVPINSLGGNGLKNMQVRAEKLGGLLHTASQPGGGTTLKLLVKL